MKLTTLTLLLMSLLLSSSAGAQTTNPIETATAMTREMSNRLHLNEGQFVKLFSLNRTRLTRQQEIEQGTKNDATARTTQLAELQSQYDQECARILSASQLSQLLQQDTNSTTDGGNG
jgi:hypothetical protein